MLRNLLHVVVLLFISAASFAQSFHDGLYFGFNVNPGLMHNSHAYFPGVELTTTSGVKVGYFGHEGIVGGFTGIQLTQYKYSVNNHDEKNNGTQSLRFLEVPIGMKVLAGPARGAKFYIEPALSIGLLTAAYYSGYSSRPDAYPSGNNRGDCTAVTVRPSLGWGFHVNAGPHCAIIVGWQISTTLSETYNRSEGLPSGNQHTTMAMQFGFEYHLSDIRRGRADRSRPKPNRFYDVNG